MHTQNADPILLDVNPVKVRRRELPVPKDKDPLWRAQAIFTRPELEQLISDTRLPDERRMLHALLFLTGVRFGEAAALRWSHGDRTLEPLGRLLIAVSYNLHKKEEKAVKTEATRKVPVHPVLATMLAE